MKKLFIAVLIGIILISCNGYKEPPYKCVDGQTMSTLIMHHKHNNDLLEIYLLDLQYKVLIGTITQYESKISYIKYKYEIDINNLDAETQYKTYKITH